jgi:hypothetical protein
LAADIIFDGSITRFENQISADYLSKYRMSLIDKCILAVTNFEESYSNPADFSVNEIDEY